MHTDTGVFQKEGNIYDPSFEQFVPDIRKQYPTAQEIEKEDLEIKADAISYAMIHIQLISSLTILLCSPSEIRQKHRLEERGDFQKGAVPSS